MEDWGSVQRTWLGFAGGVEAALALAGRPGGVLAFESPADRRAHAKAMAALATRLAAPRRAPAPSRKPCIEQSELEVGESLALADGKGGWWLLRVVTLYTRFGGRSQLVEVLDWRGRRLPDAATVARLRRRRQPDAVIPGDLRRGEMVAGLIE